MTVACSAIAKSGSRCRRPALAGKQHCLMHDPGSAGLRLEASKKGGFERSAKARAAKLVPEAMTPAELAGWLSLLFTQVMTGRVEPKIGTACAAIARTLLDVRTTTEIETRLCELESLAGIGNDRRFG